LGLLTPTAVSAAGYRRYDTAALMRLQQIAALKQLGFSLAAIKRLVADQSGDTEEARWRAALDMQLAAVRREQERLLQLERRLRTTLNALEMTGEVQPEDIFMFIRSLQPEHERERDAFLARTFTAREATILKNLPRLDADDPRTQRWVRLVRDIRTHMHEPPDSPVARRLADEVVRCGDEFFHGDEALMEKYWDMIRPEHGETRDVWGLDAELGAYVDAILAVWYDVPLPSTEEGT
jgi:DNA-binding transcriptional MerR regulator